MKRTASYLVGFLLITLSNFVFSVLAPPNVARAGEWDVLPLTDEKEPRRMLARTLLAEADQKLAARQQAVAKITTKPELLQRQKAIRDFLKRTFEPWPPRTPLNAQVTGTLDGDGYHIEKVIYESRPKFHVTATLYLPNQTTPQKFPGVLIPCGHTLEGKAFFMEQRVAMLLAKHGIAALCYDPIGQAERYQMEGSPQGLPRYRTTCEHTYAAVGALLLGRHGAADHVWDGIRSLDYLLSRPEIDAQRIGCTGNSGGGNMTAFLMALDDRIHAAMPVCWLTQYSPLLHSRGTQDAEQNLHGLLAAGFDKGDFVLARAPKATLIGAGIKDSTFEIGGVRAIFREAQTAYALLGAKDNIGLAEADEEHGYSQPLREACVRFFRQQFFGVDAPVHEPAFVERLDRELLATRTGSVMQLPGERSVYELHGEAVRAAVTARIPSQSPRFMEQLGFARHKPTVKVLPAAPAPARGGIRIERLVLTTEPGVSIPALAFIPANWTGEATIYLHSLGKSSQAGPGEEIEKRAANGQLVLALDPRGVGETASLGMSRVPPTDWSRNIFDANVQEVLLSSLLGKSLVAQQTNDIMASVSFLQTEAAAALKLPGDRRVSKISLEATGNIGVAALHAAYLLRGTFAAVTLRNTLSSWERLARARRPHGHLATIVPGALRYYDLPQLVAALPPETTRLIEPVDPLQAEATPSYADYLTHEHALAGWIAVFDGESTFGFQNARREFNGTHAILRGGVTTTEFADFQLIANVVEGGEIKLAGESRAVKPGRVELTSRNRRGPIDLGQTVVSSLFLRPLALKPLFNGRSLENWRFRVRENLPKEKHPRWRVEAGAIRATGGPGALEYSPPGANDRFDDFLIQVDVCTLATHTNGGLFVRNQPDTTMMGYEAQLHNRWYDRAKGETGCWTGSIDDRQDGRKLVSVDFVPFRLTVVAHGKHLATWINGYQQTDWIDERPPHENPRRGCRVEAGTIQLQAHDAETDIEFRSVLLQEFPK